MSPRALSSPSALALPALPVLPVLVALLAVPTSAQQPQLWFQQHAYTQQAAPASLVWAAFGPSGNVYVLLADLAAGQTTVLGAQFDLALSPSLISLGAGILQPGGTNGYVLFPTAAVPAGTAILMQFGEWDLAAGFGTLRASNVDSIATIAQPAAIVASFDAVYPSQMTGVFDTSVTNRLQALPPSTRTVRPLPPQSFLIPMQAPFSPLHPSGSRFQLALRAADLGASGVPETLTAVRWRPLFGVVQPTTLAQFELLAAHTAVVPDYTIDPWSALPMAPNSGLSTSFASNPAGPLTTMFSGAYAVQPGSLLPSGYLPFPSPQQPFVYDGQRTLLLETRCSPQPGPPSPLDQMVIHGLVLSAPNPFATVYASAGWNGQPSPLVPTAATTGTGGSFLYDWELEFVRTTSVATSGWLSSLSSFTDYTPPIAIGFTPPGTSMAIEFRGALDFQGSGATAWSTNQDVADGKPFLQFRVTMVANAATGAVPWLDTLIVPVQ